MERVKYENNTTTVVILLVCLLVLVVLLIFLYKKLNKEADGQYTVQNMWYKKGGIRDRVRGAALTVGALLGVQLWPRSEAGEEGEEMQELQDEESQVEEGGSQQSDNEGDDQEDEDDNAEQCGVRSSDAYSSSEGSEPEEEENLPDQCEGRNETEEKREMVAEGEGKGEASGGTGLLIDLKQFSGSAIWSEEGGESKDGDVTVL